MASTEPSTPMLLASVLPHCSAMRRSTSAAVPSGFNLSLTEHATVAVEREQLVVLPVHVAHEGDVGGGVVREGDGSGERRGRDREVLHVPTVRAA